MSVNCNDLLEYISAVLASEGSTLADGGSVLGDGIREEGERLLKDAGWQTQDELETDFDKSPNGWNSV